MTGKKHSKESNEKFSKARKGIKYSKERNNKIREALLSKRIDWNEKEINLLIQNPSLNNDQLYKLLSNKSYKDIIEKRRQLNLIKPYKRQIKCIEKNIYFNSIVEANKWLGKGDIANCLRGKQKTAGGYHWEYVK